jgi:ferric-dicitrate binding protein FerR (iron transport regulator)
MTGKNYKSFSAEDFASDTYFQKWILEEDYMANLFWEKWLADNPKKLEDIDLAKKMISQFRFKEYTASQEDFNEVWKNIKETHSETIIRNYSFNKKWYAGIAAAVVLIISTITFFNEDVKSTENSEVQIATSKEDIIQIGTDKAILTLADGSDVELRAGEIYKTKNVSSNGKEIVYNSVSSSGDKIAYNYLTTPRGGQFFVKLSDGTQVWLNSQSQLKYPETFSGNKVRQVELVYGEAYFDVSPSTDNNGTKFKVLNQAQEVEVLGTEFNIKAYKDESNLLTTLVEGKVAVNIMNKKETLLPNQQLKLELSSNKITTSKIDVYREVSWKNGVFSFKNKPLKDIMRVLSRWYAIDVVFKNEELQDITFNGTLKKKLSIVDIMETITNSNNNINYEINGKTVSLK